MALKGNWIDKINGVDENSADDINQVAHAVIEVENSLSQKIISVNGIFPDENGNVTIDVSGGGGMSATAKNLLITILRNGVYTTDQSANITALETALGEYGGGDNTGGVTQTGSVLYIAGGVTATQSGTTLIVA